jgi:RimJ/RimL family protein N-acetyltransferase
MKDIVTDRLLIKCTSSEKGERLMFESFEKIPEGSKWLYNSDYYDDPSVYFTVDIDGHSAYLNRMDASGGKGLGKETLIAVIQELKKAGINLFTGYIERANIRSQSMMRSIGAVETTKGPEGSYWELSVADSKPFIRRKKSIY